MAAVAGTAFDLHAEPIHKRERGNTWDSWRDHEALHVQ